MSFKNINEHAFKAWSSTTASDTYDQFRPDYNSDSVGFLLEKLGALKTHSAPFTILELGAGTGKFTRAVVRYLNEHSEKNVKIISTDPIKEMCDKLKEMVPNIEILQRRADDLLGLPSNSADAVVAAHCLHWFANSESMNEIQRVLKDKGMLGMIWNVQDRSISWIKAIEGMLDVKYMEKKIPDIHDKHWHLPIKNHGGFGTIHEDRSHQYNMELDFQGVIERYRSISVVSAASDSDKEAMLSEIRNVMKTDPNVKDQEKYTYNFIVHIEWVPKKSGVFRLLFHNSSGHRMGVGTAKLLQRHNMGQSLSRLIFKETNICSLGIFDTRWHPPVVKMSTGESINIHAARAWSQTTVANMYEETRPDYNSASVEFLLEKVGALKEHSESNKFTIAELGAGTGKFTRAVLRVLDQHSIKNVKVVSTEPIEEMCRKFKEMVPNVEILQCPAENLSLPTNSSDAVLAGNSFHWFANAESVSEIHRVLKPKGVLGIIWNLPDRSVPWIKVTEEMLAVKYKEHKIAHPELSKEWLHQINNHGGFGALNEEHPSYQCSTNHDFETLMGVFKTYSIVAAADKIEKEKTLMMIENEIRASYDVNNHKNYTFDYIVDIKWFQKK